MRARMIESMGVLVEPSFIKYLASEKSSAIRPLLGISAAVALHYFDVIPKFSKEEASNRESDSNDAGEHRIITIPEHVKHAGITLLVVFMIRNGAMPCHLDDELTGTRAQINEFLCRVVTAPITEELLYTYVPYAILGKYAKFIMPARFAALHTQYPTNVQLGCGVLNFMNHSALQAGYIYTPILVHVSNNFMALLQEKLT